MNEAVLSMLTGSTRPRRLPLFAVIITLLLVALLLAGEVLVKVPGFSDAREPALSATAI